MRATDDRFEINESESISWDEVKTLRLLNNKLAFVLNDNTVFEVADVRPSTVDSAFRFYEKYLKEHPEKLKRHYK